MNNRETNQSPGSDFSDAIRSILTDLHSADLERIDAAIARLKQMDKSQIANSIKQQLYNIDPRIRSQAGELLLILEDDEIDDYLPLLWDPVSFVRLNVINGIIDYGSNRVLAIKPLIELVLNDPDSDVRALSAVALGMFGDERAIPALMNAKENDFGEDYEGQTVSSIASQALEEINNRFSSKSMNKGS